jgi:hypothetical protein
MCKVLGNRQPATGNRQPATGNRQPATGNRQSITVHLASQALARSKAKII